MYFMKNRHIRDNIAFLIVSFCFFNVDPALAVEEKPTYETRNFIEPLSLSRGTFFATDQYAGYFDHADSCTVLVEEMAWNRSECDYIENVILSPVPGVNSVIIDKPNSEGHVELEDWDSPHLKDSIDEIWSSMEDAVKDQSKRLNQKIEAVKWVTYPTLDKENSILYYAILLNWDGNEVVNIKASLFDRKGYVAFRIIPEDSTASGSSLAHLVTDVTRLYAPKKIETYASFTAGDKVAAGGALGVLATLVGVKYGKAAGLGVMAIILAFLKKAWILLLGPIVFLKKFFSRKNKE